MKKNNDFAKIISFVPILKRISRVLKKLYVGKIIKKELKNQPIGQIDQGDLASGRIKKIGVLAEKSLLENVDIAKNLEELFGLNRKNIVVLGFLENDRDKCEMKYHTFSEKDFGLLGKLKNSQLKKFIKQGSDLLINYCKSDNIFSNYVVVQAKKNLVAGYADNAELQNISINMKRNDVIGFNKELAIYLHKLQLI